MLIGEYKRRYLDPKGVLRTKNESFNYTGFDVNRTAEVSLSYRLISVETGSIIFNESLAEHASDSAERITCPKQFVQYLSSSEKHKLKAFKEPKSKDSLINEAIDSSTKKVSLNIINKVSPF